MGGSVLSLLHDLDEVIWKKDLSLCPETCDALNMNLLTKNLSLIKNKLFKLNECETENYGTQTGKYHNSELTVCLVHKFF